MTDSRETHSLHFTSTLAVLKVRLDVLCRPRIDKLETTNDYKSKKVVVQSRTSKCLLEQLCYLNSYSGVVLGGFKETARF